MEISNPAVRESYKQLSLIYTAYLFGIIFFSGFVLFAVITNDGGYFSKQNGNYHTLRIIFAILVLGLIPLAFFLHKHKTGKALTKPLLKDKLLIYRNSFIIKAGIIEFLGIINAVLLFLYGDLYLLIPLILFILYLIINRPGVGNLTREIGLSPEEKRSLRA